ncbi:MAG: ArsR/SmtB family transcription factor [Haloarculaceae archaeon]
MTEETEPRDLLDVLSDEHAREILEVVSTSPLTAPEIADRCGISRATAYRRLERLERVGLVASEIEFDPDGHHRHRYSGVPVRLSLRVRSGGLDGTVSVGSSTAAAPGAHPECEGATHSWGESSAD